MDPTHNHLIPKYFECNPRHVSHLLTNGEEIITCVGDTVEGYLPAGFRYVDQKTGQTMTYDGPAKSYSIEITDFQEYHATVPDPEGEGCASGVGVSGASASEKISINGGAPFPAQDFSEPMVPNSPWNPLIPPEVNYFIRVVGSKGAPFRSMVGCNSGPGTAPVQDQRNIGTDRNGVKFAMVVSELRVRVRQSEMIGPWASIEGMAGLGGDVGGVGGADSLNPSGSNVPPCVASNCGSNFLSMTCIDAGGGKGVQWIHNCPSDYRYYSGYSCPDGRTFSCSNGAFKLDSIGKAQCSQDSDCSAPDGAKAFCLRSGGASGGHCGCGDARLPTPFGETVSNQVTCLNNQQIGSCSLDGIKDSYNVGDTMQWTVNSTPSGKDAFLYRTRNGLQDIFGEPATKVVTGVPQSYTFTAADAGNYVLYYKVGGPNGGLGVTPCQTNTVSSTVGGGSDGGGNSGSSSPPSATVTSGASCDPKTPCDQSFKNAQGTELWCRSINGTNYTYMALADLPHTGTFTYACGGGRTGSCTGASDMPTCTAN